jgi:hypothetical protein
MALVSASLPDDAAPGREGVGLVSGSGTSFYLRSARSSASPSSPASLSPSELWAEKPDMAELAPPEPGPDGPEWVRRESMVAFMEIFSETCRTFVTDEDGTPA